jgi:tubulin polyglutamylase TTLL4
MTYAFCRDEIDATFKSDSDKEDINEDDVSSDAASNAAANRSSFSPEDPYEPEEIIYLIKSVYNGRPATVFFPYPVQCGQEKKDDGRLIKLSSDLKVKFKISDSVYTYNCVVNTFGKAGISQTDGPNWNLIWSAPLKPEQIRTFDKFKKCNHFPGTWNLGRKDSLWRNVSK